MKQEFTKISEEVKAKLNEIFSSQKMQETISQIKSAEDSGTFEIIVSTSDVDRSGEVIDQNGWDLTHYKNNPIVLWGHNYYELPIGITDSIDVRDGKLVAKGRFAPENANPFAQQVRRLYDAGIVKTASVGFIVREIDGKKITKSELLEWSFVPVPANPMALSLAKQLNINTEELITKGIFVKAEESETIEPEVEPKKEELPEVPEPTEISEVTGVLTEETRTHINETINGMKATIAALEHVLKGNEGKEHHDGDAPKQRSINAGSDVVEALKGYNQQRQVLRLINNITSDALRKINDKARSK